MNDSKIVKVEETKETFRERVSDLLEDMWEKIGQHHHGVSGHSLHDVTADTDLSEEGNAFTYSLELAGIDEKDIEVIIDADRLIIRGEKRDEREEKNENYVFKERRFGRFERSFTLPANVDQDKVQARFDKGVLTVTVTRKPSSDRKAKKIKITSA